MFKEFNQPPLEYHPKARYWMPEGMVDTEDIRKDVHDLKERGFGSIEVVAFMPFHMRLAPKGYRWGEDAWIKALQALLDEAMKCNMKVDIANGPSWPIAMPGIQSADDASTLYELTYGIKTRKEMIDDPALPLPKVTHEEGTTRLIACFSYKEIKSKVLDINTYQDLMPYVANNSLDYDCSMLSDNSIIFAFYTQPACQKVSDYYVIDHLSKEGIEACRSYWLKELYPYLKPYQAALSSIFCDSIEYKVSLEWTRDFEEYFMKKKQYSILPYLAVIGTDKTYPHDDIPGYAFSDKDISDAIKKDYFDVLSDCFSQRHLIPLEELANEMGMHVRYQVAYNKPVEIDRAATSISYPEGEALNRASLDNLKSMAGAVHLSHMNMYSYECSAEFENGYGQTFEDIFWWIKRSYCGGMNQQVFHGAAYSGHYYGTGNEDGYFPGTTWPGYESFARVISNYWNRTLDKEGMHHHLDMIARYNMLLQKKHIVDLAIYRPNYINDGKGGDEDHILNDHLLLSRYGYQYDFVAPSLLENVAIDDHKIDINGPAYQALVIPPQTAMSNHHIEKLLSLIDEGLSIFMIEPIDNNIFSFQDNKEQHKSLLQAIKERAVIVSSFEELITALEKYNIYPRVRKQQHNTIQTVYTKDKNHDYYYFYNMNVVRFGLYPDINPDKAIFDPATIYPTIDKEHEMKEEALDVLLEDNGYPVIMDAKDGTLKRIPYEIKNHQIHICIPLRKDEAILITLVDKEEYDRIESYDFIHSSHKLEVMPLDTWQVTPYSLCIPEDSRIFADASYQQLQTMNMTAPFNGIEDIDMKAGYLEYTTEFSIDKEGYYAIKAKEIIDTFFVQIDNQRISCISEVEPIVMLPYLDKGNHQITITVYTNLRNELVKETKEGIYGNIELIHYENPTI